MNIFVLDSDPTLAAQAQCDKHVVKMVTELWQQLGSAVRRHGATDSQMPDTKAGKPLGNSHPNHPCTRWVGDGRDNFLWAAEHAIALANEYEFRYKKRHFCLHGILRLASMSYLIPQHRRTPFAQAMPDEYKQGCAVQAYRDYYWLDKRNTIDMRWDRGRMKPEWWLRLEALDELTALSQEMGLY